MGESACTQWKPLLSVPVPSDALNPLSPGSNISDGARTWGVCGQEQEWSRPIRVCQQDRVRLHVCGCPLLPGGQLRQAELPRQKGPTTRCVYSVMREGVRLLTSQLTEGLRLPRGGRCAGECLYLGACVSVHTSTRVYCGSVCVHMEGGRGGLEQI